MADEHPDTDDDARDGRDVAARARRAARTQRADAGEAAAAEGLGGRGAVQFVRECVRELRRVQWPGRQELWSATAVVLIACIVVGVYLAALDSVFTRAARWLIDQQAG